MGWIDKLLPPIPFNCKCPWSADGWNRLGTTKGCPVHDPGCTCQIRQSGSVRILIYGGCLLHDPGLLAAAQLGKLAADQANQMLRDSFVYHDEHAPKPRKYPNDCPCGVRSADCDYHKDA